MFVTEIFRTVARTTVGLRVRNTKVSVGIRYTSGKRVKCVIGRARIFAASYPFRMGLGTRLAFSDLPVALDEEGQHSANTVLGH